MVLKQPKQPRTDGQGNIYIPHKDGVAVVTMQGYERLHLERNLTGDGSLTSVQAVAVVDDTTLFVIMESGCKRNIYLLDIVTDTVLFVARPPIGFEDAHPKAIASSFGSVMVGYGSGYDILLHSLSHPSWDVIPSKGSISPTSMHVDPEGHFLISDSTENTLWVLSETGEILDKVKADKPCDVAIKPDLRQVYIANCDTGWISVFQQMP